MRSENYKNLMSEISEKNIKLPILIFDEVWLTRFPKNEKTSRMSNLENNLKEKIKEEAKAINENKNLKFLKNKFLKDILYLSEKIQKTKNNSSLVYKMNFIQKKINEINEKIDENEEIIVTIPKEIQKINFELLEETVRVCYNLIEKTEKQLDYLEPQIEVLRMELRNSVDKQVQIREKYNNIINLLHDIVGCDIMDYLDKDRA